MSRPQVHSFLQIILILGICVSFALFFVDTHTKRANYILQEESLIQSNCGRWAWDVSKDELVWDERMIKLFGFTPKKYEDFIAVVVEEDKTKVQQAIDDSIRSHYHSYVVEYSIKTLDGQIKKIFAFGSLNPKNNILSGICVERVN